MDSRLDSKAAIWAGLIASAVFMMLEMGLVGTIRGDSYRLREKRRSGLLQRPAAAPETVNVSS